MLKLFPRLHQTPILENINNNQLKSRGAMPHKDSPSDNQTSFSMNRHEYLKTVPSNPSGVTESLNTPNINKKWYGNSANQMSSRITETRKMVEIGKGSLNLTSSSSTKIGFTKANDTNLVNRAKIRVRRTGGAAPPKTNR
jgi:hypothetical protein